MLSRSNDLLASSLSTTRTPRRARLAALLSAAALVAVAAPAAAEEPLAPVRELAPLAPLAAPTARRNPIMMVSGMALVGVGVVVTTVGAAIALSAHPGAPGSEDDGGEQRFRGLMIGAAGLGTSFVGIPLWIIGGSSVPARATLSVGAGGASLGGSF